jgi:hypothetical protein
MTPYTSRLTDMHAALCDALDVFCASAAAEVLGTRLRRFDEYDAPTLPAVIVGTARLDGQDNAPYRSDRGEAFEPTEAQIPVWIVVPADKRSTTNLYTVLPLVAAVLDDVEDAVVMSAGPGRYPSPTDQKEFPAYEVIVEYAV